MSEEWISMYAMLSEFVTSLPVAEILAMFSVFVCVILLLVKELKIGKRKKETESEEIKTTPERNSRSISKVPPTSKIPPLCISESKTSQLRRSETQSLDRTASVNKHLKDNDLNNSTSYQRQHSQSLQNLEGEYKLEYSKNAKIDTKLYAAQTGRLVPECDIAKNTQSNDILSKPNGGSNLSSISCQNLADENDWSNLNSEPRDWSSFDQLDQAKQYRPLQLGKPMKKPVRTMSKNSSMSNLFIDQPEDDRPEADVSVETETESNRVEIPDFEIPNAVITNGWEFQDMEIPANGNSNEHKYVIENGEEKIQLLEQDNESFRMVNESLITQIVQLREELYQMKLQRAISATSRKESIKSTHSSYTTERRLSSSSNDEYTDAEEYLKRSHSNLAVGRLHCSKSAGSLDHAQVRAIDAVFSNSAAKIQNGDLSLDGVNSSHDNQNDGQVSIKDVNKERSTIRSNASMISQPQHGIINRGREERITFQIICVGDSGVGKTSFIGHLSGLPFPDTFNTTVGVDFVMRPLVVDGRTINIQIWDTAGQERYRCLTRQYLRKADAIFIFYDVTSESSYRNVRHWMTTIQVLTLPILSWRKQQRRSMSFLVHVVEEPLLCLIGNKRDLVRDSNTGRVITSKHGTDLANEYHALFHECSAKSGDGIDKALDEMTSLLLQRYDESCKNPNSSFRSNKSNNVNLRNTKDSKKGVKCCGS